MNSAFTSPRYNGIFPEIPPKKKGMSVLQKFIIVLFALTILTTIISLGMFYIEKPFFGYITCPFAVNPQYLLEAYGKDYKNITLNMSACLTTQIARPPSQFMDAVINLNILFGTAFVISSGVLVYKNYNNLRWKKEEECEEEEIYDPFP